MTHLSRRAALARLAALASVPALAACGALPAATGGAAGPALVAGAPVPVALLVPAGSSDPANALIARSLENAARLAAADLSGVAIDLRVYPTGGDATRAAAVARTAADEGAAVILGPLYAEEAVAASVAVADRGINVLSFSTNPTIAGGNLFLLGSTFGNAAERVVRYGRSQGLDTYLVAYGNDLGGTVGRDEIVAAANRAGATVASTEVYAISQADIQGAAPRIAAAARAVGADGVFTTAGPTRDLPVLASSLAGQGLLPAEARLLGIQRFDVLPAILTNPGLEGAIFPLPDMATLQAFEARYQAAYGEAPHTTAPLAYDGIAAIGALAANGGAQALARSSLTRGQGFQGTAGIFRFGADNTAQRGLAVAEIRGGQVVIVDPAPRRFGGTGL